MGKGDKKTRRGKITRGTYGVRRPRKTKKSYIAANKTAAMVTEPKTPQLEEKKVKTQKAIATEKEVKEIKAVKKEKTTEKKASTKKSTKTEKKE